MPTSRALSMRFARSARLLGRRATMAVVKLGLAALALIVGTLAAAEGALAQTETSVPGAAI